MVELGCTGRLCVVGERKRERVGREFCCGPSEALYGVSHAHVSAALSRKLLRSPPGRSSMTSITCGHSGTPKN